MIGFTGLIIVVNHVYDISVVFALSANNSPRVLARSFKALATVLQNKKEFRKEYKHVEIYYFVPGIIACKLKES